MNDIEITKKIIKKIGKLVAKNQILDILTIINDYLYEEILNDKPIYIGNFGVINQRVTKSRIIWSKDQNKYIMSNPTKSLVFRPTQSFTNLIKIKLKILRKKEEKS